MDQLELRRHRRRVAVGDGLGVVYLPSHPLHAFSRRAVVDRALQDGLLALTRRDGPSLGSAVQERVQGGA